MGILAALFDAQRTGTGTLRRRRDERRRCSRINLQALSAVALQTAGRVPERGGDQLSPAAMACYGDLSPPSDGRLHGRRRRSKAKFWDLFCDAVGRPDLASATTGRRVAPPLPALRSALAALFASRARRPKLEAISSPAIDCCVTPVLDVEQALRHPHFTAREMVVEADGVRQYAPPLKLSGWVFAVERAAPAPGEHAREILRAAGYSDEELAALQQESVI
jgi:alpha-methylacyl-CoA racemase